MSAKDQVNIAAAYSLLHRPNEFLESHRERREKAKDVIDQYHIKR